MTTAFPLSDFVITIFLFFLKFCKMWCSIMWRFAVVEIRIGKIREMCLNLIISFFICKVVDKRMMNLFEDSEDFGFSSFI